MADVTRRMLDLLATLQSGRRYAGDALASRLGVSPRTLRRDIDRLRGYGYPVTTQPGPGGYYQLARGATLPPLMVDDDEAVALLAALAQLAATGEAHSGSLAEAAGRAYTKIDQYLPRRLRARTDALRAALETGPLHAPRVGAELLARLAEAVAGGRQVRFGYTSAAGTLSHRRVEPHRTVHHLLRWYLLGWDLDRDDWRVFRLDRLRELEPTGERFTPRPLPDETAVAFLVGGLQRPLTRVVVSVTASRDDVAAALAHREAELTPLPDGGTRIVLHLDDWRRLIAILTLLEGDVRIEEPAGFRAAATAFGRRLAAE